MKELFEHEYFILLHPQYLAVLGAKEVVVTEQFDQWIHAKGDKTWIRF